MDTIEIKKQKLIGIIKKDALITGNQQKIVSSRGLIDDKKDVWILDFRNILLDPGALELMVEIFWHHFEKEYPFQVGGQEIAAIPLVSAIVLHSQKMGKPVNGFFIRKSRKPIGLQKIIEGKINDEKIILVDDLINSGLTILRQIAVMENVGKKIDLVFTIINYRGEENEKLLLRKNVRLFSFLTPEDIGLSRLPERIKEDLASKLKLVWRFQSSDPIFFIRTSKSTPCLDKEKIYFGTDNACFWALKQADGSMAWKFENMGYPVRTGKIILSSPSILKNNLYFGAYDGNVYAINKETGKLRWKYMDADFVGSSPCAAPDLNYIFVGLEFGLFKKRGGLVALEADSGKKMWEYKMTDFVHSSPAYCKEKKIIIIGCNDFSVYLFEAKTGKLKWKYKTRGAVKASFVFDIKRNLVLFGSFDKHLYALDIDSGELKGKYPTKEPIFSTPLVHEENVYFGSMDKHLYSINLDTGKINWHLDVGGRIFARPKIIDNKIYIGSTNGILYEIEIHSGKPTGYFIATERITNEVVYNEKTGNFFLPTYANEIYCLKKIPDKK